MSSIRVLMSGGGRMGGEISAGLLAAGDVEVVGVLDGHAQPGHFTLADGSSVPLGVDPAAMAAETRQDAAVDFSFHEWTSRAMPALIQAGVRPVIGTSGLSEGAVDEIERCCRDRGIGGVWVSNFAVGAVLMMHFAKLAAPHYAAVEVIELHHDGKVDAPSGTALATARS